MSAPEMRRLFNVNEYHRMGEAGVLSEDDRVELIEGEIVHMSPIGSRHAGCIIQATRYLTLSVGKEVAVSIQNPVRLDDYSEPQPDIVLLRQRSDDYRNAHPAPADVLLLIEVCDSSLDYDQKTKIPLYARAGIPEVWLVDLNRGVIHIYAQPAEGRYTSYRQAQRGETIQPEDVPQLSLAVDTILGLP